MVGRNTSDMVADRASDAREQIARLREQVESLMRERVNPAISDAAGRVDSFARSTQDTAREQAAALTDRVRDQPLVAVVVAAGIGFLLGRISR